MVQENHIDKALAFMESLEKLGNQLKAAEEHQKQLIARTQQGTFPVDPAFFGQYAYLSAACLSARHDTGK